MISLVRSSIIKSTFSWSRGLATATSTVTSAQTTSNNILPNAEKPSEYSIATLRSFPSLEPHSIFPIHNQLINLPLRRDILWLSVVMELDNRRVGSSNPPGRSEHKFSRRKLFKQKGTGRARVGDANSPIRFRGAYAMARTAPNDFSTELPKKVYYLAYRTALSDCFRKDKLYIIGNNDSFNTKLSEITNDKFKLKQGDSTHLEIVSKDSMAIKKFVNFHNFEKSNLLFIADDYFKVSNLRHAILKYPSSKLKVLQKDEVEVRDLLKANKIFIEKEAFNYFAEKFTKFVNL